MLNKGRRSEDRQAERFESAWNDFVLAIRRAQARGQQSADDLTLAQYYLLAPLEGGGPLALCALAESAGIAPPTATRLVDGLESAGLLVRRRSDTDRRSVLISLTEEGRDRVCAKHRQLAKQRHQLYQRLEPDERKHSEQLLRHLAELVGDL